MINLNYLHHQFQTKLFSQNIKIRLHSYIQLLNENIIDLQSLQLLTQQGIPDDLKGLRSLCWKLLTAYLPPDQTKWYDLIHQHKETYHLLCSSFLNPILTSDELNSFDQQQLNPDPNFKQFYTDQTLWDEIEKDTIRTRSELSFFQQPTQLPDTYPIQFRTQHNQIRKQKNDLKQKHYDILTRILFIYAKMNPAIKYVQGMNEILAPIYFVYYNDTSEQFLNTVESDAFFTFTIFMGDAKDSFIRQLDDSQDGIKGRIEHLNKNLKVADIQLWSHLDKLHIDPQYYSLRWMMLYLTQEFELFDVLRIWDALLSKKNRNRFLIYLCLGLLVQIRKKVIQQIINIYYGQILVRDFTDALQFMQKIKDEDVIQIIHHAHQLYQD